MSGIIILAIAFAILETASCLGFSPIIVKEKSTNVCPAAAEEARNNASQRIQNALGNLNRVPDCGEGFWLQVANLNMSDPQQNCPSSWSVVEDTPARSCVATTPCDTVVSFPTSGFSYMQVCGRAIGYATGSPDAFRKPESGINGSYFDGVSITHGRLQQHIWSFGAGHGGDNYRCPCDNTNRTFAPLPRSFVGNNYFCDGDYNGALWDGESCNTTSTCCTFNNPPWFSAALPARTSDEVEARICQNQDIQTERVYLNTLLLYVQ